MKILLATVPVEPTFQKESPISRSEGIFGILPKIAIVSLVHWMEKHGYSSDMYDYYDIDMTLPSDEEFIEYLKEYQPTIVGLSAVVSTSYKFTKEISLLVKKELPETIIMVGGNLAASAEILIKQTGVDFCVLGEGETILLNFMNKVDEVGLDLQYYKDIKGYYKG